MSEGNGPLSSAVLARLRAVIAAMSDPDGEHNHNPFDPGGETQGLGCDACWRAQLEFAIEPPARHTRWSAERVTERVDHLGETRLSTLTVPLHLGWDGAMPLLGDRRHRQVPVEARPVEVPSLGVGSGWGLLAVDAAGNCRVVGLEYVAHGSSCEDPVCIDVWNRRVFEAGQLPDDRSLFVVQPAAFTAEPGALVDYLAHTSDLPDGAFAIECP